jgi:hypothetical protein
MINPFASCICRLRQQFCWLAKFFCPAGTLLIALAFGGPAFAADVRFSDAPTTAQQAWETLFDRRETVTKYMACGDEIGFLKKVNNVAEKPGDHLPDIIGKMLWLLLVHPTPPPAPTPTPAPSDGAGRLGWQIGGAPVILVQGSRRPVRGTVCERPAEPSDIKDFLEKNNAKDPSDNKNLTDPDIDKANAMLSAVYDDNFVEVGSGCQPPFCLTMKQCEHIIVRDSTGTRFVVSPACMRQQINVALSKIKVKGQPGTDGSACHIFGKSTGDWDVDVRDLTRVLYLHMRNSDRHILLDDVAKYVSDQLLTLSGPPGLTSYSLFQCGNQENSTGSPQDRAAERSWLDDTLNSVGDVFDWLWKRIALLIVLLAVAGVLAAVVSALSPELAAIVAAIVGVAGVMIAFGRVPETENHLLMIESSRYLKNQEMISRLNESGDDTGVLGSDQMFVKHFLMSKFQDILKNDFQEYNSRPYSRYSLLAIQNVAQFADDPELQNAARMVLQFSMAKAAIGSYRGRRLVPYRRHMNGLRSRGFVSLFDNTNNGDHLIPLMMFFTGQTQHLPNNSLPLESLGQMIYYASGMMGPNPPVPDNIIMEAAIEKSRRYEQRIGHAGAEYYSGGDGWLVTAGGIQTGPTNFFIAPIAIPFKKLYFDDDRGAAWPTTLMLSAAVVKERFWEDQKPMEDFIRIEGLKIIYEEESQQAGRDRATADEHIETITSIRRERGHWRGEGIRNGKLEQFTVRDETTETFEGNLCVGMGFACGFNLEFPFPLDGTRLNCGDARPGNWTFFDTDKCYPETAGRPGVTRAFIAAFRDKCPHPTLVSNKCRNFGLLEVISFNDPALAKFAPDQRYENFIRLVLEKNSSIGVSRGSVLSSVDVEANGTYVAVKENDQGQRISIRFQAELSGGSLLSPEGASLSRIVSIDGRERSSHGSWKIGTGDFINGDSKGRIEIGWPARPNVPPPRHLILDLSYYRPDTVIQDR